MPMKEFTMDYVIPYLMHEMSKRKENEPQDEDAAMVSWQDKMGTFLPCQGAKLCYYCWKLSYIAHFCYRAKNKEREQAKNVNNDDDYAFTMRFEAHSKSMCKWIMNLDATKHITSYKAAFNTYEIITPRNMHLDDNSIVQAIGMGSIVVEANFER